MISIQLEKNWIPTLSKNFYPKYQLNLIEGSLIVQNNLLQFVELKFEIDFFLNLNNFCSHDITGPPEFCDSVIAEKIADFSVFRGIHYFPWNL